MISGCGNRGIEFKGGVEMEESIEDWVVSLVKSCRLLKEVVLVYFLRW